MAEWKTLAERPSLNIKVMQRDYSLAVSPMCHTGEAIVPNENLRTSVCGYCNRPVSTYEARTTWSVEWNFKSLSKSGFEASVVTITRDWIAGWFVISESNVEVGIS